MEQATFTLSKEMDKLRCLKKQRARALLSLEVRIPTIAEPTAHTHTRTHTDNQIYCFKCFKNMRKKSFQTYWKRQMYIFIRRSIIVTLQNNIVPFRSVL